MPVVPITSRTTTDHQLQAIDEMRKALPEPYALMAAAQMHRDEHLVEPVVEPEVKQEAASK